MHTDLYKAILNKNLNKVKRLVEEGADPNERDDGVLPLYAAVSTSNISIIKYLISIPTLCVMCPGYIGIAKPRGSILRGMLSHVNSSTIAPILLTRKEWAPYLVRDIHEATIRMLSMKYYETDRKRITTLKKLLENYMKGSNVRKTRKVKQK